MRDDLLDDKEEVILPTDYLGKLWQHALVIVLFVVMIIFSFFTNHSLENIPKENISTTLLKDIVTKGAIYYFLVLLIVLTRDAIKEGGDTADMVRYVIFTPIIAGLMTLLTIIFMVFFVAVWYLIIFFAWRFFQPDMWISISSIHWLYANLLALFLGLCSIHYMMYRRLLSA